MNLYFLVEGKRTEKKVYPRWLAHLAPELVEIKTLEDLEENNYYIFNGNGFPSLLHNHLKNSIEDVNENGEFDYLVICLDSDELETNERYEEVMMFIENESLVINRAKFIIIIQNRCIESWMLGNRMVFKANPQSKFLRDYINFFNVRDNDPELMPIFQSFETHSQFHYAYLKELLTERNIRYTKNNPNDVVEPHYLTELIDRASTTNHIRSFKTFLDFCNTIKSEIKHS